MPATLKSRASQASSPQAQGWYDSWKAARNKGVVWDNSGYGGVPKNTASQADQLRLQQLTQEGIAKGYMPKPSSGGLIGGLNKVVEYGVPIVVGAGITAGTAGAMGFGPLAPGGASTGASFGGMGTGSMTTAGGGTASTGAAAGSIGSGGGFGGGAFGAGTVGAAGAGSAAGGSALGQYAGLIGNGLSAIGSLYGAKMNADAMNRATDAATSAANRPKFTGHSSINPVTGETFIDPSIRSLRERALGRLPQYRTSVTGASNQYLGNLDQTRNELASNENPFIQARVNPLLAQAAAGRGALSRSLNSRGLGGSSLFASSLGNYDALTGREIGDQRALATNEALLARTGIDTQRYQGALSALQAFQGLDAQEQSIAGQNLAQELSALGLSQAETGAILQAAGIQLQGAQSTIAGYGRAFDSIGRTIGSYGQSA